MAKRPPVSADNAGSMSGSSHICPRCEYIYHTTIWRYHGRYVVSRGPLGTGTSTSLFIPVPHAGFIVLGALDLLAVVSSRVTVQFPLWLLCIWFCTRNLNHTWGVEIVGSYAKHTAVGIRFHYLSIAQLGHPNYSVKSNLRDLWPHACYLRIFGVVGQIARNNQPCS